MPTCIGFRASEREWWYEQRVPGGENGVSPGARGFPGARAPLQFSFRYGDISLLRIRDGDGTAGDAGERLARSFQFRMDWRANGAGFHHVSNAGGILCGEEYDRARPVDARGRDSGFDADVEDDVRDGEGGQQLCGAHGDGSDSADFRNYHAVLARGRFTRGTL